MAGGVRSQDNLTCPENSRLESMDRRNSERDSADLSDPIPDTRSKPQAKRRASRAGSRSVATLSAEQLARKRANDREAQRLIRQRTKDHIERLENRIRELTEGQHDNLEEVQQRNVKLERELQQLKESLQLPEEGMTGPDCSGSLVHRSWHGRADWLRNFQTTLNSMPESSITSFTNGYGQALSVTTPPLELGAQYSQSLEQVGQRSAIGRRADTLWGSRPVILDPSNLKTLPSMRLAPTIRPPMVRPSPAILSGPAWQIPLLLKPPSCPVDHLLIGIIQRQRRLLAAGAPGSESFGPYHPSMRILAYPDQSDDGNALSTLIANLLHRTSLSNLPEKAACLFVMYHLAQWQIAPSPETYRNLPEWHTARLSQIMTPHPIWVSQIPFGKLRDRIIENQETYATEEFQTLYTASLSLNWPRDPTDILVFDGNDVRASDEFVRHCTSLGNWSLGAPFSLRYPELSDCCKLTTPQQMSQEARACD